MAGYAGVTVEDLVRQWDALPAGLVDHMRAVSGLAGDLASRNGVNPHDAELVGFLHDVARSQTPDRLLALAAELAEPVSPVEADAPILLHGPVGSRQVLAQLPWVTPEMADAIRWHSTGRWGMGPLEKVVFLADKLEPGKNGYYRGLDDLTALARTDINAAIVRYLEWLMQHLFERGQLVHPASLDARNWILLEMRGSAAAH